MAANIALQADISNIPTAALGLLSTLQPFLKALSADEVDPGAVLKTQLLGSCFRLNGLLAARLPELLRRHSSIRLERLAATIGWQKGDTAALMSQSGSGQAAAVISLALRELYPENIAGEVLYDVAARILPDHHHEANAGPRALGRVAATLANKIAAFGWGRHLAEQVTKIRVAYLHLATVAVPRDLLDVPTEDTMAEFLQCLAEAFRDDATILRIEGSTSVGHLIALVTALCPDNVAIHVEGMSIFQGRHASARSSAATKTTAVVFSVRAGEQTTFGVETVINIAPSGDLLKIVATDRFLTPTCKYSIPWEGCLSTLLDLLFMERGLVCTTEILQACANVIAAVATMKGDKLSDNIEDRHSLPLHGLKTLLGPFPLNRIRDAVKAVLLVEPTFATQDPQVPLDSLLTHIKAIVPSCRLGHCETSPLANNCRPDCDRQKLTHTSLKVIESGIAALFVTARPNSLATFNATFHGARSFTGTGALRPGSQVHFSISTTQLHRAILHLVAPTRAQGPMGDTSEQPGGTRMIGTGTGACTIFPTTLISPRLPETPNVEYILTEGCFQYGSTCYTTVIALEGDGSDGAAPALPPTDIIPPATPLTPSGIGAHECLTLSLRRTADHLLLRTAIQGAGRTVEVSFWNVQLGFLGLAYAAACEHDWKAELNREARLGVVTTSVLAPVAHRDGNKVVSVAMTSFAPEAQFLCCRQPPALLQRECCLECAVRQAKGMGFRLVIGGS